MLFGLMSCACLIEFTPHMKTASHQTALSTFVAINTILTRSSLRAYLLQLEVGEYHGKLDSLMTLRKMLHSVQLLNLLRL